MNDVVSDTLARMQNAVARDHETCTVLQNKVVRALLEVLEREGFIAGFEETDAGFVVTFVKDDEAPTVFRRVSKPGQRIYVKNSELVPVMNGRGIGVVSTSEGVMTSAQAKSKGLGGEYICQIW